MKTTRLLLIILNGVAYFLTSGSVNADVGSSVDANIVYNKCLSEQARPADCSKLSNKRDCCLTDPSCYKSLKSCVIAGCNETKSPDSCKETLTCSETSINCQHACTTVSCLTGCSKELVDCLEQLN